MSLDFERPHSFERPYSKAETHCRSCGVGELKPFLDLGETPLANRLIKPENRDQEELRFPLVVALCENCGLVQITETVDPHVLFADQYPYYSSSSPALVAHARQNALAVMEEERKLGADSLVVELASNDGYLLKNYVAAGVPVLGIDPAENQAKIAESIGVPTLCDFFDVEMAKKLRAEGKAADVIHANNVFAHVPDINSFVGGMAELLKEDGVIVIESPYLLSFIDDTEFDTVYHEHYFYYSVIALTALFNRHGLYLNRIKHFPIHGGTIRMFIEKQDAREASVQDLFDKEEGLGADKLPYFISFSEKVNKLKADLLKMIAEIKAKGETIAAYGAAAKGATLVNFCGVTDAEIDFAVDCAKAKQGMLMPGSKIPILHPDALLEKKPDYCLMLAWNFADEILEQQQAYRDQGGKFIIPVPTPKIV